jgi:hypothetical protein
VVATGRDSLRTVTTRSSPRSRENPASVPRAAPIAVCRIVPGSPLDQVFLGQHSTQPHGLDGLGPSEKRKVTGSTPVPTTNFDHDGSVVVLVADRHDLAAYSSADAEGAAPSLTTSQALSTSGGRVLRLAPTSDGRGSTAPFGSCLGCSVAGAAR